MKPFSLTAVLKYRKQLEDSAAQKLTQAQTEMLRAKQNLETAEQEYSQLLEDLDYNQSAGIGIEDLIHYENRLQWLKNKIKELENAYQDAANNVMRKRENVIIRSRNKKVIERLKTKQDQQWQSYLAKKENSQLDEIAVLSHDRKQRQ